MCFYFILLEWHPVTLVGFRKERRKGRGTRDQIANRRWIIEKATTWLYNVLIASAVQRSESALCLHIPLSLEPPSDPHPTPLGCPRAPS